MKPRNGFTFVEVLVVIAIICMLVAVIAPVAVNALKKSHESVAISELRQCSIALSEYTDDLGNDTLPPRSVIQSVTARVNCDPGDYWRRNCTTDLGSPMVGSFGYLGGIEAVGQRMYSMGSNPPVFADIFYSDPIIPRVCGLNGVSPNYLPSKALFAFKDSSVSTMPIQSFTGKGGGIVFNWLNVFYNGSGGKLGI